MLTHRRKARRVFNDFLDEARSAVDVTEINVAAGVAHDRMRLIRIAHRKTFALNLAALYLVLNLTSPRVPGPLAWLSSSEHVREHVRVLHRAALALTAFVGS